MAMPKGFVRSRIDDERNTGALWISCSEYSRTVYKITLPVRGRPPVFGFAKNHRTGYFVSFGCLKSRFGRLLIKCSPMRLKFPTLLAVIHDD